ncbi:MAG: 3-oxoacyl-ACP reductase [Mesorhizobium amorphae]|nr:MAG: 3-oxoacyl-ACP reductase [Mesorhizobium amorphae]
MERRTAVVTGAGSGVGRAGALKLLKAGWNVAICGRREEALAETGRQAGADGERLFAGGCDITDEAAVDAFFAAVAERFGRIDLLFNNAGQGFKAAPIDEMPVSAWRTVVDVNLNGAFLCARAAFRQMRRQSPQGGRIVNNGSVSAHAPRPGSAAYTATKHAITGLTKTLALDGRPFDIACGQLDIGNALTEMAAPMAQGVLQADGRVAAEAVMDVERVADALLFMGNLPLDANVLFMTVMATKMPFVGRG